MADYDTGIYATPSTRPSVFTPPGTGATIPGDPPSMDYGVGSTPSSLVNVFDPATRTVTADPGDVLAA